MVIISYYLLLMYTDFVFLWNPPRGRSCSVQFRLPTYCSVCVPCGYMTKSKYINLKNHFKSSVVARKEGGNSNKKLIRELNKKKTRKLNTSHYCITYTIPTQKSNKSQDRKNKTNE